MMMSQFVASIADEVAALRSLARRLSEPWPAEERLSARIEERRRAWVDGHPRVLVEQRSTLSMRSFPHMEVGGFWQHRRSNTTERREPVWHAFFDSQRWKRVERQWNALAAGRFAPDTERSWMPSITGIGPIALRWAPTVEREETEEWQRYEAIRATLGTIAARYSASLVADHLAPHPRHVPAAVKHIAAQPRDWSAARDRRSERERYNLVRGPGHEDIGRWETPEPRCHRATLGTLAARYTPRRPDGSYNRHDARRFMRRFRTIALIASDALEQSCDRMTAIETLCEVVGLEDALRLTERPVTRSQPGERPRRIQ